MRLFVNELGRFDYLLHILKNLLRFVKYFEKKFSLGIYAPLEFLRQAIDRYYGVACEVYLT